jgi:hypothetical protein
MDFNIGLSIVGIGIGIVISLLSMRPMKPMTRKVLLGFGVMLIVVGAWGVFSGFRSFVIGGDAGAQKPPVSLEQTNPYNSPPIVGDRNTVTINPEVNPNAPVKTYDFNGAERTSSPGNMNVVVGAQFEAFQSMVKLQDEKNWTSLRNVSEQEMRKTPEWLTPRLFAAVADMNLGKMDEAIEYLDYVRKKAGGNPDYANADRLREEIRQKTGK